MPKHARKTIRDELTPRKAQTLEAGLKAVFPLADLEALEGWKAEVAREAGVEFEFLLFLAVVSGTQYRVTRPDPEDVLGNLRSWLTALPKSLDARTAEVLLEALRPRIEEVMNERGWQEGPGKEPILVRGRPPETPGAWAAAVLIDAELCLKGIAPPHASGHAKDLASVLLGRPIAPNEFYRVRTAFTEARATTLIEAIRKDYEFELTRWGTGMLVPPPPEKSLEERRQWRERFRGMLELLAVKGCEEVARATLASIPEGTWPPSEQISHAGRVRRQPEEAG